MNPSTFLDAMQGFLFGPLFACAANASSIAAFCVTVVVWFDVRRIRRAYFRVGRWPDLTRRLDEHTKKLSDYLNDAGTFRPQIEEELVLADVTLESFEATSDGYIKKSLSKLRKTIRSCDVKSASAQDFRGIYVGMLRVQAEIADWQKNQKWEIS